MKLRSFIVALCIYLPTLVLVPQQLYLIYCVLPFAFYKSIDLRASKNIVIIFSIILLSIINQLVNSSNDLELLRSSNQFIPYSIFILFIYLSIPLIDRFVLKYILIFISIEVGVGIIEHLLGIPFIIKPEELPDFESFGSVDLLYYKRVHGLSKALSLFAQKIFVGILILNYIKIKEVKSYYFYWGILIFGLYITFNRSAIGASIIFLILVLTIKWFSRRDYNQHYKRLTLLVKVMFIAIISILIIRFDDVINQFNRGRETTDFSKRDEVYPHYIDFINEHLLMGNGSFKLLLEIGGKAYHAHNSFLAIFASNGVVIFLLYMGMIVFNIRKNNYIYVLPIMAYSLLQFGIFWGISFLDILFLFFLFNRKQFDLPPPTSKRMILTQ